MENTGVPSGLLSLPIPGALPQPSRHPLLLSSFVFHVCLYFCLFTTFCLILPFILLIPSQFPAHSDSLTSRTSLLRWSLSSPVNYPKTLQCANIELRSDEECRQVYPGKITANMLCAGTKEGGKDSCEVRCGECWKHAVHPFHLPNFPSLILLLSDLHLPNSPSS